MSVINMKSFMIICLYLLLDHHGSEGITTHSVTGCSDSVDLSCHNFDKLIHVERITYYNGTDCNQTLTDQQVCGQPLTGSDTGLSPSCNGLISCAEIFYYTCPGSKAARVDYRCVPRNKVKDMCDVTDIENTNRILLSTPNFPSQPIFNNISPCRCYIRGANITSIEILELILQTSNNGTKSSLEINYGDVTFRTESHNYTTRRVYNIRLTSTSSTAEIILNHNNINKQYLWIEIQGVSIRVRCNYGTESTSSSPSTVIETFSSRTTSTSSSPSFFPTISSSTTSTSSSTTTSPLTSKSASDESDTPEEPPFTSPASIPTPTPEVDSSSKTAHLPQTNEYISIIKDKDQTNIALAVMLSLLLLVICLTVVVVFMLYRKGKLVWVKKSPEVGERNPYSGLDLTQKVAGSDGTYQVLSARNSTPQYNNVSQPVHPEYQNVN